MKTKLHGLSLHKEVDKVRSNYGSSEARIFILGDYNARVGVDGSDNIAEECNEKNDEICANGMFGFEGTDDNGAELLTF